MLEHLSGMYKGLSPISSIIKTAKPLIANLLFAKFLTMGHLLLVILSTLTKTYANLRLGLVTSYSKYLAHKHMLI